MKKSTKATDSANKESVFQNLSKEERIALTVFFLTPLVALLFLEYANPAGPGLIFYSIRPSCLLRFGVTAFLFYIVMGFLFALTGSMRFSGCFLCIFSIIFSLTNYFTTTFRGIPILASDLTIMGTAMNVVGNYKYSLDLTRTITLLGLIAWCILLFRVKRLRLPKGKKKDLCHPRKCRHLLCFLLDHDLYAGYDCDTDACHCQYVPSDQILPQKRMRPDFYAKYPVDDDS